MLVHRSLAFQSLSTNYPVLKVVTKKEGEVFYINQVVQFLQRKRVEVRVDSLERQTPQFSILSHDVYRLCNVFHCELNVLRIEQTTQEKDQINILWGRPECLCLFILYNDLGTELFKTLRQVLAQAHKEVLIALVAFSLDKHGFGVKIFAKVLAHIPYYSFVKDVAADS